VTVSSVLLATATAAVLVAATVGGAGWLAAAAALAVVVGWAVQRIAAAELAEARRAHARERAAQARAFRGLLVDRSAEHATFAAAVHGRIVALERQVRELEATLRLSERRAEDAESRARLEAGRTAEARRRVAELEVALAVQPAESADEVASWSPATYADMDTVVDLLAWEDRTQQAAADRDDLLRRRQA
jgi:hypothetical protein